jgi:ATPase subunit of ABC transporter with duplicated ATPase domains
MVQAGPERKMSLIQVRELSIEFGGNYILREISCTVEHNSRLGLIGPNGCGKSTLIKLMLGELNPTLGTVSRSSKAVIAYLPQNAQPDQDLTWRTMSNLPGPI